MIFVIKVTTNKENLAVDLIADKCEKKHLNVHSVVIPHGLKGYLFLEAEERESAEEAVFNLPYVKGIIGKTVTYEEISNMLETSMESIQIKEGDIVEIIGSTLKGEKGKIQRIDRQKSEVTLTLLGAVVPLPVTTSVDNIKVIRRESDEEQEDLGENKNAKD
jgi:transcription termination/antitermination protein NusG